MKYVLFISLALLYIQCQNNSSLELKASKSEKHVLVGQGVYMILPYGYTKARSYEGYQRPDMSASFSVKKSSGSVEESKAFYESDQFKRSNLKLRSLKPVTCDSLTGFICEYLDKRSKFISQNLIFPNKDGGVLKINFLVHHSKEAEYKETSDKLLHSIYIDHDSAQKEFTLEDFAFVPVAEFVQISDDGYQITSFPDENNEILYTRDGQNPTTAIDSFYGIVKSVRNHRIIDPLTYMQNFKVADLDCNSQGITVEPVSNGKILTKKLKCKANYHEIKLLHMKEESESMMIILRSNNQASIKEGDRFLSKMFIQKGIFAN